MPYLYYIQKRQALQPAFLTENEKLNSLEIIVRDKFYFVNFL